MNEILEKLLKSEFLSEDSKLELQKEFQSSVEALRESIVLEEKLKVAQQWTESKMELAESLDKIIDNQLQESLAELRLDIKQTKLENDRLLESIEQFISSEVKELNEDIQLHRNNDKALVESLDAFLTSEISGSPIGSGGFVLPAGRLGSLLVHAAGVGAVALACPRGRLHD